MRLSGDLAKGYGLGLALLSALPSIASAAQEAQPSARPGYGFEQPWKATFSAYRTPSETSFDGNVRKSLGDFNAWLGAYVTSSGDGVFRLGLDWTFRSEWLRVTPTVAAATNGFFGGQLYAEAGREVFLIGGFSRTNLKEFFNLTFDPNESVQLGLGIDVDARDRVTAFSIFDVRLGTGQQDSHLVWRRWLDRYHRLTLDLVYKSGHTDQGDFVRGAGVTATFDWARYFVRAAYDPYVNFTAETMWRVGGGVRF